MAPKRARVSNRAPNAWMSGSVQGAPEKCVKKFRAYFTTRTEKKRRLYQAGPARKTAWEADLDRQLLSEEAKVGGWEAMEALARRLIKLEGGGRYSDRGGLPEYVYFRFNYYVYQRQISTILYHGPSRVNVEDAIQDKALLDAAVDEDRRNGNSALLPLFKAALADIRSRAGVCGVLGEGAEGAGERPSYEGDMFLSLNEELVTEDASTDEISFTFI